MILKGIGGHTRSFVALLGLTAIILASGEETQIHFFLAKGSFNIVLGRLSWQKTTLGYNFPINNGKYSVIKSLMKEYYEFPCANLKKLDGKLVHLEEWIYAAWTNLSQIRQERNRPLRNKEQPYEWQLENCEVIQKPPNEDYETELISENEYIYLRFPYITLEDLHGDEAKQILGEEGYLCHLPGENLSKIQFSELSTEEGIKGNLSNQFWDEKFEIGILPRRGLYFNQIWAQWCIGLNGSTYENGRHKWVEDRKLSIDEDLWWSDFT
ncbi:hypothetical protein O181_030083 [Austropuccinia psidii MF-1]|uniref:Uncharacterized protein n=1 Tax=Austropuccinia psidii MF-1 TaxID=1389203 RepID=A0A9Q3CUU5_9BASI|nr:hypothetical protein [Austropuccinia psidii MF-1]